MGVFIIAEAGVNHNGCLDMAKELIDVASQAGADAVKFQTFKTEELVTEEAEQSKYQSDNMGKKITQFEMLKELELTEKDHDVLMAYCEEKGIEFMSTPFDLPSIELLVKLGVKRFKIPSGEMLSVPYLRAIAKHNLPTILSTGMGNLSEVEFARDILFDAGLDKHNLTILHANSAYPTPYADVNLKAMTTLGEVTGVPVGLSDHSLGIAVPVAAVALGAVVVEKHFTLDRSLPGPDHKASLNPIELTSMVTEIHRIELALGEGNKQPTSSEMPNVVPSRKSIVASQAIQEGEVFSQENLTIKRPGDGISSMRWDEFIGKKATKSYLKNEQIIE